MLCCLLWRCWLSTTVALMQVHPPGDAESGGWPEGLARRPGLGANGLRSFKGETTSGFGHVFHLVLYVSWPP